MVAAGADWEQAVLQDAHPAQAQAASEVHGRAWILWERLSDSGRADAAGRSASGKAGAVLDLDEGRPKGCWDRSVPAPPNIMSV
jgi:hypothetical protein